MVAMAECRNPVLVAVDRKWAVAHRNAAEDRTKKGSQRMVAVEVVRMIAWEVVQLMGSESVACAKVVTRKMNERSSVRRCDTKATRAALTDNTEGSTTFINNIAWKSAYASCGCAPRTCRACSGDA
jgi:beta-lactamase superfamily II metal-dependent hydrolase